MAKSEAQRRAEYKEYRRKKLPEQRIAKYEELGLCPHCIEILETQGYHIQRSRPYTPAGSRGTP